jgi:hypothetical protein
MTSSEIPIRRIGRDATAQLIGHYLPAPNALRLVEHGFPLLGPGEHLVDGDLPWVLQDMAPAGYLARRFARWFPELGLGADPQLWTAAEVLKVVTERGHDLPGDLVVGDESWSRYEQALASGSWFCPDRAWARARYEHLVSDVITDMGPPSSVGGERPKFALRLADGAGLLVKFTPPISTLLGRRWSDLLRFEAHCLATLRSAGVPAVHAEYVALADRGYLEVERFDRLPGGGRAGVVTLFWLGASRYGEVQDPCAVVERLRAEGFVTSDVVDIVTLVHRFSAAIGNTDAHLGNYALTVGDQGELSLAPLYDVLPMVFAPRHDELPDAHLAGLTTMRHPSVAGLVADLVARVTADPSISADLVERWLQHIGR